MILTGVKSVLSMEDLAVAECLALRWAMDLIRESEHTRIILETDYLRVCDEYTKPNPRSQIYDFLEDIRVLADELEAFSLTFTQRDSNIVVHNLAKFFSKDEPALWLYNFPDNISLLAEKYVYLCEFSS